MSAGLWGKAKAKTPRTQADHGDSSAISPLGISIIERGSRGTRATCMRMSLSVIVPVSMLAMVMYDQGGDYIQSETNRAHLWNIEYALFRLIEREDFSRESLLQVPAWALCLRPGI